MTLKRNKIKIIIFKIIPKNIAANLNGSTSDNIGKFIVNGNTPNFKAISAENYTTFYYIFS